MARLRVDITDVNNKGPEFQGVDVNGQYPAAVSASTQRGDEVIFVSAIDLDSTAPNNVVSELLHVVNNVYFEQRHLVYVRRSVDK